MIGSIWLSELVIYTVQCHISTILYTEDCRVRDNLLCVDKKVYQEDRSYKFETVGVWADPQLKSAPLECPAEMIHENSTHVFLCVEFLFQKAHQKIQQKRKQESNKILGICEK